MQALLVSIIIPVYNAEKYLEETLTSIFNQTYKNIELICVNDGSTDDSLTILEKYDSQLTIINQKNAGQCVASNKGLELAKGDYIKFFDADDIMNPEHIELQVKKLNGRTDAIASCEWGRFYANKPEQAVFKPEPVWKDMPSLLWLKKSLYQKNDMMGAWLWLIPKQILTKTGGWDERLGLNNDFEFSTRILLQANEVLFTPGAKVYYRSGLENNLAGSKSKDAYQAALLSTDLGCSYLLKHDASDGMKRLCANRYQIWLYRIFPQYPSITKEIETKVKSLGGSSLAMEGGKVFKILQSYLGWKLAKRIQHFMYSTIYKPKHPHK
jgi:glycosyltransferase involved in cell wall biosynthesis